MNRLVDRGDVIKMYEYDSIKNKSVCRVPSCKTEISGRVLGNMKRHIFVKHPNIAKQINLVDTSCERVAMSSSLAHLFDENSSASDSNASIISLDESTKSANVNRPSIKRRKLDSNSFLRGCVKLCAEENLPFSHFNSEGFRLTAGPHADALGITINAANMPARVKNAANAIRNQIKAELKDKLFSVKVDAATKLERGLLGINAQFVDDGLIHVRTLGVIELTQSHTGEYLKSKLRTLLEENYGFSTVQVYSVTTDNGANMVKAVSLMEHDQKEFLERYGLDLENDEESQDFYVDVAEKLEMSPTILNCVRCVAHTLQLVVADVAKNCKCELQIIRDLVKKMKTTKFRERFALTGTPRPMLDVVTRWMSTYLMVKNIFDNMEFYNDLNNDPNIEVEIPANIRVFIATYVEAFTPLYFATKHFQETQLTMGDFFKYWIQCSMECRKLAIGDKKSTLAAEIVQCMKVRQMKLFENPTFLAAVYMDPRFNFSGSNVLTPEHKRIASDHIFKTYVMMKRFVTVPSENDPFEVEPSEMAQMNNSELDNYFHELFEHPSSPTIDKTDEEIRQKINNLSNKAKLPLSGNVLASWEMRRYDEPDLFQISQVILAVPPTQVSVERAFSALGLILTARRNRLGDETIDDLLVCKLNADVFDKMNIT